MIKRLIIMLVVAGILFGLVFGFGVFRSVMIGKFLATLSNPVQTVATIKAETTPWQPSLNSVGSLVAINGANLSAELDGIVDTIDFKSGEDVAAGTLLLTLRPNNQFAVLAQLQATATLNQITYKRDIQQFHADAVSQATLDTDKANLDSAQAQVLAQQTLIAEKQVRAPFAGRLGIRQVDIGQYLAAGTQIVTLQQLNPLFIDFYLPQQALAQINAGQTVSVSVDAFPGQIFAGIISAINSAVDTASRTVQVRATIQNDDLRLRPGMFATVNINAGQAQQLITLPQTAIAYNSYGDTVFTLSPYQAPPAAPPSWLTVFFNKLGGLINYIIYFGHPPAPAPAATPVTYTATQVFVTLGDTRGDQVAILQGVNPGDEVVTAGQLKLKNGSLVTINNSIQPSNDANPNLPNE